MQSVWLSKYFFVLRLEDDYNSDKGRTTLKVKNSPETLGEKRHVTVIHKLAGSPLTKGMHGSIGCSDLGKIVLSLDWRKKVSVIKFECLPTYAVSVGARGAVVIFLANTMSLVHAESIISTEDAGTLIDFNFSFCQRKRHNFGAKTIQSSLHCCFRLQ